MLDREIEYILEEFYCAEYSKEEKAWVRDGKIVCTQKQFKKASKKLDNNEQLWETINDTIGETLESVSVEY